MLGQTLKHFEIEETLGKGGMGVVYRSRDTKLQRRVALKVLSAGITADPEKRKRFLQEARAAARVTHPSIAQVYDVDEADGITFIAMELVEGRTVSDLILKKELDLLGAIDIAIQVGEGLMKAHEAGIVHRDIKPANVMLTKDGHAKVLDFGLAKLTDPDPAPGEASPGLSDLSTMAQTQVGTVMGTAAYMSPEQVKGAVLDFRSDIFSLGVMIFEMATWESPFRRTSLMETMHSVAFDETPSLCTFRPNLPVALQRIVSRCLRKRPEDRYQSAAALVDDLKVLRRDTESGWLRPTSLKDRVTDAIDRVRHLTRGEYAWLTGGVLVVALIISSGIWGMGWGGVAGMLLAGLFVFRYFKNHPHRLLEFVVRKVSRIPEVRLITVADRNITVVVDRPVPQLYGRINGYMSSSNKKLFFGKPLSVTIRHDLRNDEFERMLNDSGVHYVRSGAPEDT